MIYYTAHPIIKGLGFRVLIYYTARPIIKGLGFRVLIYYTAHPTSRQAMNRAALWHVQLHI